MSAETKHTPGPWHFDPNNHGNGGPGYGLLNDSGSIGVTVETATSWHKPYPAAEANARLIAAAPELLEACKAALADIEQNFILDGQRFGLSYEAARAHLDTVTSGPVAKLRAAIKKAGA